MNSVLVGILTLLAGSGVFLTGMKLMSDGLEQSAGPGIRKMFNRISNSRFAGIGIGAGVTAIIQSSAATTVMVIGFVNAGIMTLFQATAIIMGANIGTTVTGIIVSFSAFDIDIFAMALAFIGVIMAMFFKTDVVKKVGGILSGLGLIFVGLDLMSGALATPQIKDAFVSLFTTIKFPLLLILFGAVFTALIQSSSAATGLIIIMAGQGLLTVESALFIVLGTNIGTCVTAIIASLGTSANAKRAAFIHLTFNVIGTIFFTLVLLVLKNPILSLLSLLAPGIFGMQIAYFHLIFNVITTALLCPFIKQLTWFASKVIKMKADDKDALRLYFIDDRILQTPPIAVSQTLKEVRHMADLARDNLNRAFRALIYGDTSEAALIRKEEQRINFINKGTANYLVKMASLNLPVSDDKLLGTLHHVISDIERIGDHAENILEEAEKMKESSVTFSQSAIDELNAMFFKVTDMYWRAVEIFEKRDPGLLLALNELECEVDAMKRIMELKHIDRLNKGECSVETGVHFYAVITSLERIADHLTNISYSIKSPAGMPINVARRIIKNETINKAEAKKAAQEKLSKREADAKQAAHDKAAASEAAKKKA